MSLDLIEKTFFPPLENPILKEGNDAGVANVYFPQLSGQKSIGRIDNSYLRHEFENAVNSI